MNVESRFKLIRTATWIGSFIILLIGLAFVRDPDLSPFSRALAALVIEVGGAFFFAILVGWILDRMQDAEGYSKLWLFSQEFRKAGVLAFYADRKLFAEQALEKAFEKHNVGEVLLAGASLRLFLASGQHFYPYIENMLAKKESSKPIIVKALSCDPESNHELPVRSFIEEFNQDKTYPKHTPFDWGQPIGFSFDEFERTFYEEHGINAPGDQTVRVINDLESTRKGVTALQGIAKGAKNILSHREFQFAPYCTVVIFPDKAFYTPNLLGTVMPINMPMSVFHRSSNVYEKLKNYIDFLWWVSDKEDRENYV